MRVTSLPRASPTAATRIGSETNRWTSRNRSGRPIVARRFSLDTPPRFSIRVTVRGSAVSSRSSGSFRSRGARQMARRNRAKSSDDRGHTLAAWHRARSAPRLTATDPAQAPSVRGSRSHRTAATTAAAHRSARGYLRSFGIPSTPRHVRFRNGRTSRCPSRGVGVFRLGAAPVSLGPSARPGTRVARPSHRPPTPTGLWANSPK
jgi:hypothetical protein